MEILKNKKILITVSVAAVVVVGVVLAIALGKDKAYRVIKVFETEGKVLVSKGAGDGMEAYANMVLNSGDQVESQAKSKATLKVDDDKYLYMEENTKIRVEAAGSAESGKTTIVLEDGAITNEIQNPLADNAAYEVNTPNSTMSVRGTIFRADTYYDENGVLYTRVSVFKGKVSTQLVTTGNQVSEEEVFVEGGKEVIIYQDDKTTDYVGEVVDINYEDLPKETIRTLIEIVENGTELEITLDELKDLLEDDTTTEEESTEEETSEEETTEEVSTEIVSTEETSTEETSTEEETSFTVTFMYNGAVFGTQEVVSGETVSVPALSPSASGSWDFDFSTPITEDTTIYWKE